ncbi:MAG: valine--tRNA ligase [Candidatus Nanoarchaeia archaeon]|nr:valine--tRNA ligase [Candidatus Nanoarchaeia archaeon]MDD5740386.1 valine--tRNA ligase [Candidatus Nanoarchaeia archaeon]
MDNYDSKKVEEKIRRFWDKEKIFKFDLKKKGRVYSIDTPPPTVSGKMHIGHAYMYSQMDFVARFRRMFGLNVFYPFGTDDNGLPTERLIEKLKNVKSKSMKREEFIKLCLKTLKEITPGFIQDWRILGISADYSLCYSTIDDNSRRLSQKSFIELYKKGLIYKKGFPTLWCPECQTSVAQAELEDKEIPSLFSTLKFNCNGKDLLIATTRPELLGACVAVFVNPKDKRYADLIGKKAKVPLFDFEVPVISDESADMEKGTGVLMICSYGDKYDAEAINRHKLEPRIVLNLDGTLKIKPYEGLKIKEARKKILEELKEKNLITEQKQISHAVNTHDKCGTEIEFLPTEQWFIKILDKKKKFIEQGNKIKWHPEFMHKRYDNWVNGLEWDWNISRDRHFGVPIPVWQCEKCKGIIIAEEKDLPVDPTTTKKKCLKCKQEAKGEEKVLDTWMTSSISPQIASSLIKEKVKIPFSLRPQAHDIIRTWLFYTLTKSLLHENKIPWENVMVSGFVTLGGEKMSKSKGNVISPQEVMEKYSADTLRFWAAGSKLGEDLDYQEKDIVAGKKFETKLWNASRFVFMNLKDFNGKKPKSLIKIDELFLRKLNSLVKSITGGFENYEYSKAKIETEKFFWQMFCDNYLEIVKKRIYNNKKGKESAQYALYTGLLTILKLIAPIMPFITEEIYLENFKKTEKDKSIHISKWPEYGKEGKADEFDLFISILGKIRQEKTNNKKAMNAEIILTIEDKDYRQIKEMIEDLKDVANAREIKTGGFGVEFV